MTSFCNLIGKWGLVLGIANEHSIAAAVTRAPHSRSAALVATCLNEKAVPYASAVAAPLGVRLKTCNVSEEGQLELVIREATEELGGLDFVVHSIAWAPLEDLHGRVIDSSREGFERAISISCHSFAELGRLAMTHMPAGGSLITMTYHGARGRAELWGHGLDQGRARVPGALHGGRVWSSGNKSPCGLSGSNSHPGSFCTTEL